MAIQVLAPSWGCHGKLEWASRHCGLGQLHRVVLHHWTGKPMGHLSNSHPWQPARLPWEGCCEPPTQELPQIETTETTPRLKQWTTWIGPGGNPKKNPCRFQQKPCADCANEQPHQWQSKAASSLVLRCHKFGTVRKNENRCGKQV